MASGAVLQITSDLGRRRGMERGPDGNRKDVHGVMQAVCKSVYKQDIGISIYYCVDKAYC